METPPFVNDTVPHIVESGDSERVQQRTAEYSEGVPQIAEESVEIEMPVPQSSEQIVYVPEDVDAEILGYEKAIRHCQGHIGRAINDLKTNQETLQQFEKMQTDLRERLPHDTRGSRWSPSERRELQGALDEQEFIIRHHHQDVQTRKRRWRLQWVRFQEKRELTGTTVQTMTPW